MEHIANDMSRANPPFGWKPGMEGFKALKYLFDCARYHINLRVICRTCGHSAVIDAAGHWWSLQKQGRDDHIGRFVRRLYCEPCLQRTGTRQRNFTVEQTSEPATGPLLPGPTQSEWKRFVVGQRR
jgi:hypothetical protein